MTVNLRPAEQGTAWTEFMADTASLEATGEKRGAWLYLTAMTALILSYLWVWQGTFKGDPLVVVAIFSAIAVSSHKECGETAHDLGFRLDNFWPALKTVMVVVLPIVLLMFALGIGLGFFYIRPPEKLIPRVIALPLSSLVQQYGLLGFYFRRFRIVNPGVLVPTLAAVSTFALFHMPNIPLTIATFLSGLLACLLYQKVQNLYALAIAHSILSFAVDTAFSGLLVDGMKVGHRALG